MALHTKNRLLTYVGDCDRSVYQRRLHPQSFKTGDLLIEAGQTISEVFFPDSGLISVVVPLANGDVVEAAIVGYQGVLGGSAAFGQSLSINTGICQAPGSALVMRADDLREIAAAHPAVGTALFHHQHYLLAQAQQSAACNAKHHIPQRFATWVLRARDAVGKDEVDLTQEFVAQMLGVQRPSVSIVASSLQDAGLISYRRGHVKILDEKGLMQSACECYRTLRRHQERMFQATEIPCA